MTLNELFYKKLKSIADEDPFLNYFGTGDLERYALSGEMSFPFVWVTLRSVARRENVLDYNLSFVFADVIKEDSSDIIERQSDMIRIAADFAGKLIYDRSIEVEESFTLTPFTERFIDITAGVVMDLRITAGASLAGCNDC